MAMAQFSKPRNRTTRRGRLEGYDYRLPGYYFLTICQKDRKELFGHIRSNEMENSPAGTMLVASIASLENRYRQLVVDAYVVMPNHVHLLLGNRVELLQDDSPVSIPAIVDWWKTVTTKRYITGVRNDGWPAFQTRLWQSGYHDRIVRNERELDTIRNHIAENPQRWDEDTFYGNE
jgi:REP element-mobilizing transposase RayT